MTIRTLALFVLFSTGCYFYYPKFPKTPKVEVVEGAEVAIETEDHEYLADCKPEQRDCGYTARGWKRKSSYATATASYNGRPLTQWELRQLVDPSFDKKLARVKSNKGACNVSLVPSVISVIGLAALSIAGPFYDKLGDKAALVGWGSAAVAGGGALLSYPLGGYACRRAARQYREMFVGVDPTATELIVHEGYRDEKDSADHLTEMVELSKNFNARFGGRRDETPVSEAPTDE